MRAIRSVGQILAFARTTAGRPASAKDKIRAVARFGWRQIHKRVVRRPMIIDWEGMRLVVPLNATSPSAAYYFGRQDTWEFGFIERLLRPGDVVADIGANVGVYTLFMAKLVGPEGKVIACEPDARNVETLRKNVQLNRLSQVQIQEAAVGDREGDVRFLTGLDSKSKISQTDEGVTVPMRSVDSLFTDSAPVFFKVDVEGAEDGVVRGACELMKRGFPLAWQLEALADPRDDQPLYLLLRDNGYVFGYYDVQSDRVRVLPLPELRGQSNILALRDCPALHDRLGRAPEYVQR